VFKTLAIKGNGYGSFFMATFSFLKSIQILSLPLFLGTTTMGDNHVTFSRDWMNLTTNNLSISYLTNVVEFGFNLYLALSNGSIIVSNSILCYASFRWNAFQSLYVHAKTSLNSFNNYLTSNILPISNCA